MNGILFVIRFHNERACCYNRALSIRITFMDLGDLTDGTSTSRRGDVGVAVILVLDHSPGSSYVIT